MYQVNVVHKLSSNPKVYAFKFSRLLKGGDMVMVPNNEGTESPAYVLSSEELKAGVEKEALYRMKNASFKLFQYVRRHAKKCRINVEDDVIKFYKKNTRDNKDVSDDQVRKKLIRNLALSVPFHKPYTGNVYTFAYGAMHILLDINTLTIVEVRNRQKPVRTWRKDKELYDQLNKEFGIEA